tara:strand:+ start:714 stop:1790 length:1077 start_codon:yes stop_codon:yes gene_type:complete
MTKLVQLVLAAFTMFAPMVIPVAASEVGVKLDTSFAQSVLADVCSGTVIDEKAIRQSEDVKHMLAHFLQFRDYFTMDAYVAARQKAAMCEKNERDYFRFNEVLERRELLADEIEALSSAGAEFSKAVTVMLAPYMPPNMSYDGRAVVAVATPSCGGWSVGQDFFVDLPCIKGDTVGLQYLIAHESYHGMQNLFMPEVRGGGPFVELLAAIVREGTATAIADFSDVDSEGAYTKLSKRILDVNARRVQQNFDLLDMAVGYLQARPTAKGYEVVNNIGLSGSYDAPFYSVGALITETIEAKYDQKYLVCLMKTSPEFFFAAYLELQKQDDTLPKLGGSIAKVIETRMAHKEKWPNCAIKH